MDKLWAPWRVKYVQAKKKKGCVFCRAAKNKAKSFRFLKTKHSIAMLNIFPYNNGHIMVAPIRHVGDLAQLKDAEALDLFRILNRTRKMLDKVLKPQGYNIGINLGKNAGAGITAHLHIHVVPRWAADTNFMPVVFNTKVVSQSLQELHKQLKNAKSKKD